MNEENNFGAPILDDFGYIPPEPKKEGPQGVAAPVLDDMDFVQYDSKKGDPTGVSAPILDDMADFGSYDSGKKGAPTGVSAPVLDDMNDYSYEDKKGAPTGVSAPVLEENTYTASPQKLILSDEDIIAGLSPEQKQMFDTLPAEKQQQIIDMRRTQLGAEAPAPVLSAPVLDEDNYVPPPKKEEPVQPAEPISAPILDEEPEQAEYVPKFGDKNLEKIKEEAKKKAVSSQLVSNQKDEKESLRMMIQLKEERRAEMAAKGFKICIVLAVLGIIGSVAFYLLYSGSLGLDYKDGMSGIANVIKESSLYFALAGVVTGLLTVSGLEFAKSLASFVYLVLGIVQLFPGLPMFPQHNGNMGLVAVLYAVAFICTVGVFVTLSASECVGAFFSKNKPIRD